VSPFTLGSGLGGDLSLIDIQDQQSRGGIGQIKVPQILECSLIFVIWNSVRCWQTVDDAQAVIE
jgi:hypothetical protein